MTIDIKKLFDEDLPAALAANAAEARTIGATYQIHITDVGSWFVDVSTSGPACRPGAENAADCRVTVSAADFMKLLDNPQVHGMALYSAGKLRLEGNEMLALQLQRVFSYV